MPATITPRHKPKQASRNLTQEIEGDVMAWYEIINAKTDSYIADRDAEDMLRQLATALQTADDPVETAVFYGLTSNGARRY
jgi:hypothetical protein